MKLRTLLPLIAAAVIAATAPAQATIWDWSTTAASNGNSDATINFQEGQAPSTLNDSSRAAMAAIAKWRNDTNGVLVTTTGTANVQVIASNGSAASLVNGWTICAQIGAGLTNSSAATLNVDTLGAKPVQLANGTALSGGEMPQNTIQCFTYSTGAVAWILHNKFPLGTGVDWTSSGQLERSALTGDVTASAGSNTTALASNSVTTAKIVDANVTTAKLADGSVTSAKLAGGAITGTMPIGAIFDFPSTSCPASSVPTDGSAINRTTYSALFAVTSTTFGVGDGSTTFNVPDTRGRFSAGYDSTNASGRLTLANSGGLSASTVGNTGGQQSHTMTTGELVSHSHTQQGTFTSSSVSPSATSTVTDPGHTHSYTETDNGTTATATSGGGNRLVNVSHTTQNTGSSTTGITVATSVGSHTHSVTISGSTTSTGSGTPFNVVPPSIVLQKCIYTGV